MEKVLSKPTALQLTISDCSEKALQRAMLLQSYKGTNTILPDETQIRWLDIELPVEFSRNARRKCIDLIGIDNKSNQFVLCELKYNNYKDSPFDAEIELLTYVGKILFHATELDKNNIHHPSVSIETKTIKLDSFSWTELITSKPRILIMADKSYWDYWKNREYRQQKNKNDKKTIAVHDKAIECYSIDIDKEYFKKQKGNNNKYVPVLEKKTWKKANF